MMQQSISSFFGPKAGNASKKADKKSPAKKEKQEEKKEEKHDKKLVEDDDDDTEEIIQPRKAEKRKASKEVKLEEDNEDDDISAPKKKLRRLKKRAVVDDDEADEVASTKVKDEEEEEVQVKVETPNKKKQKKTAKKDKKSEEEKEEIEEKEVKPEKKVHDFFAKTKEKQDPFKKQDKKETTIEVKKEAESPKKGVKKEVEAESPKKEVKKEPKTEEEPKAAVSTKKESKETPKKQASAAKGKGKKEDDEDEEEEEYKQSKGKESDDEIEEEEEEVVQEKEKVSVFKRKLTAAQQKAMGGGKKSSAHSAIKYDPIADAGWSAGQPVPYLALAKTLERIEQTSGRLDIIEHLSNFFRSILILTPGDLIPAIYLSVNRIAPAYEGIELGIGEKVLMQAVAETCGRTLEAVKMDTRSAGDLGIVAQNSRSTQKTMFAPAKLTLQTVYKILGEIAKSSGHAAMTKKKAKIQQLLVACRDCEPQFIIRSLQGKLRIGLAEKGVLAALARAIVISPSAETIDARKVKGAGNLEERINKVNEILRKVYAQMPNYDVMIKTLQEKGIDNLLEHCHLTLGIPVNPMLAQPTKGISEVLDRFQDMEFTAEYKYDGERAQIHYLEDGSVQIYSRNLEDNTAKYPDLVESMKSFLAPGVTSFILDAECVAYDREKKKILPFQILSTRARKGVEIKDIKVRVCLYAFDLLFLNGKPIIEETLQARREKLFSSFVATEDVNDIQPFLNEAVENSCEGLMVKTLIKESSYEPSKRSYNWLKIKKDYLEGLTDTLDLVPIGAWIGRGKRTGLYGAFLLAVFDDDNEEYQTVCKIGTGFSDDDLAKHTVGLKKQEIPAARNYYRVSDVLKPDVWFDVGQVWEVLAADLSISPVHTAAVGQVDNEKGIALRFPRFIRVREDKNPENASTATQIADMYRNQKITHTAGPRVDDDY